jgi:hydroxymethylglutaryl-CoA lyase
MDKIEFSSNCYPQKNSSHKRIVEVGPRDGLQNEKNHVSTGLKVDLVNKLTAAGCDYIEAGAFVSPKAVPRMADSKHVFQQIERSDAVTYAALTPNLKVKFQL